MNKGELSGLLYIIGTVILSLTVGLTFGQAVGWAVIGTSCILLATMVYLHPAPPSKS